MLRELEYPFNAEYILTKKKSLRKALLSDGSARISKKIAILGGFTTAAIKQILELFLLNQGIEPTFYESEYNQYYQDAVFDNPALASFAPDVIYV
ncbi:MAG: HAD family hydrolase, partial [Lachnospiraceae bacterium]|nr:HAD family hydrolase [Lachnospiraceae bacterium]